MFIDELEVYIEAGNGGPGSVHFRREKYVEFGGPDGGDGGKGGSVILRARSDFNTLLPLRSRRFYRAGHGGKGAAQNMTGADGDELVLEVPPGTICRNRDTGAILADLTRNGQEVVVAQGGRGGKGNKHFTTSTHQAPRFAQPGEAGEVFWVKMELKIIADIGLVGFPNAGKSTLISRVSAARPKVADYPFTTLKPNLGVVKVDIDKHFVIADIPGIIEGAHLGAGLGLRFLRHIERTSLLLILIDPTDSEHEPEACYEILLGELNAFSERLRAKRHAVLFTKADVPHDREAQVEALGARLDAEGIYHRTISAVRGDGIDQLIFDLHALVQEEKAKNPVEFLHPDEDEDFEAAYEAEEAEEDETESDTNKIIDPLDEV